MTFEIYYIIAGKNVIFIIMRLSFAIFAIMCITGSFVHAREMPQSNSLEVVLVDDCKTDKGPGRPMKYHKWTVVYTLGKGPCPGSMISKGVCSFDHIWHVNGVRNLTIYVKPDNDVMIANDAVDFDMFVHCGSVTTKPCVWNSKCEI